MKSEKQGDKKDSNKDIIMGCLLTFFIVSSMSICSLIIVLALNEK